MSSVAIHQDAFRGELEIAEIFPTPTLEAWRKLAERSLRGASLRELTAVTREGIEVPPLATAADLEDRPAAPLQPLRRPWRVCQRYQHPAPDVVADQIAADAAHGVGVAWLTVDRSCRLGLDPWDERPPGQPPDGLLLAGGRDLDRLLGEATRRAVTLMLDAGGNTVGVAAAAIAQCGRHRIDSAVISDLSYDPLGALAADGELALGLQPSLEVVSALMGWCDRCSPRTRALAVSTMAYVGAGGDAVDELACGLATAVQYLRSAIGAAIDLPAAVGHHRFITPVGGDLLTEIAKLRVWRRLWARVVEACGGDGEESLVELHAVTSPWTLTARDPWVNLVRGTGQAFAAVVGGADAVTVLPFDEAVGPADAMARRLAANLHAILREEASLHRVLDPMAGSYAVERLTAELEERAWARFQEIESAGGMAEALLAGEVQDRLARGLAARRSALAEGREAIVGVTLHPGPDDKRPERPPHDLDELGERIQAAEATHRPPHRELERLRAAADAAPSDPSVIEAALAAASAGATPADIARALRGERKPTRITPLHREREAEPFEGPQASAEAVP
jgi:methylmalonyl-CoA mutase